jgi:hypothetical protein
MILAKNQSKLPSFSCEGWLSGRRWKSYRNTHKKQELAKGEVRIKIILRQAKN